VNVTIDYNNKDINFILLLTIILFQIQLKRGGDGEMERRSNGGRER
jgi:hypothetical protein